MTPGEMKMPLIMGLTRETEANGPGKRGLIHFQGCNLGCKNCFNPDSHAFNAKNQMSIGVIQDWIMSLKGIEGITLSGGEPLQQAPYLYTLVAWIREKRPELSIGIYTGYSKKELDNGTFKWKSADDAEWVRGSKQLWEEIRKHLDFAVTGRYVDSMSCHDEPLRGSRNQELVFFTDRYSESSLAPQIAEVSIGADAFVQITGFPTVEFLDSIKDKPVPITMSRKPVACVKDEGDGDLVGV